MQLSDHFLLRKAFSEHHMFRQGGESIEETALPKIPEPILFKKRENCICVKISTDRKLTTGYYVGLDWISPGTCIYVEPKMIDTNAQTDYLKMLIAALQHPEIISYTKDLFEIKFERPLIKIDHQQDLLSPLLIVQFLSIVKQIVRKGLKKSYYSVTENLFAKVKGKVLVATTIKNNLLKNKPLHTLCNYEEFGFNGLENRLLKKTLTFIRRYMQTFPIPHADIYIASTFNYILPAFDSVSEEVSIADVHQPRTSPFYKEYAEGIRLAQLILRRFGYNINNASRPTMIQSPPFWIDMSKLFELYVLGLLKDRFKEIGVVDYHFEDRGNELDFLLNAQDYQMVVDAKYKPRYKGPLDKVQHQDVRQLSGYARLEKVFTTLGLPTDRLIDCLIIYPDSSDLEETGKDNLKGRNLRAEKITGYAGFYKLGVRLPLIVA